MNDIVEIHETGLGPIEIEVGVKEHLMGAQGAIKRQITKVSFGVNGSGSTHTLNFGESKVFSFDNIVYTAAAPFSQFKPTDFWEYVPYVGDIEGAKYVFTHNQVAVLDKDGNELLWSNNLSGGHNLSEDGTSSWKWKLGIPTEGGKAAYEIISNQQITTQHTKHEIARKIVTVDGRKFYEFPLSRLFFAPQDLDGEDDIKGFAFTVRKTTSGVSTSNPRAQLGSWELATVNDDGSYELQHNVSKQLFDRGGDREPLDVNFKTLSREEFAKSSILVPVEVYTPLDVYGAFYDRAGAAQAMRNSRSAIISK